jgi:hypothetical protein
LEKSIAVSAIMDCHREAIVTWKDSGVSLKASGFFALVELNHSFNYQLWHAEDKARREDKGHAFVYHAKRAIDGYNQKRNDYMEAMDDYLIKLLKPVSPDGCSVHSETPGMMIDRLSILALKHYHMAAQAIREDVDEAHRNQCAQKLAIIMAQSIQLSECLANLLQEVVDKTRTFRVYRQFKMYNSAALNPELSGA